MAFFRTTLPGLIGALLSISLVACGDGETVVLVEDPVTITECVTFDDPPRLVAAVDRHHPDGTVCEKGDLLTGG